MSQGAPVVLLAMDGEALGFVVLGPPRQGGRPVWEAGVEDVGRASARLADLADVYGPRGAEWATGTEAEHQRLTALGGAVEATFHGATGGQLAARARLVRPTDLPALRPQHPAPLRRAWALAWGWKLMDDHPAKSRTP